MADPIQEQVLASIETALEAIDADTADSPYFFTARTVKFGDIGTTDLDQGPFPIIYVGGIETTVLDGTIAGAEHYVDERMDVEVIGHVGSSTQPRLDLIRLASDIRTAIWQDPTRGGLAVRSWFEGMRVVLPTSQQPRALVAVTFSFQYEAKLSDLTSNVP